MYFGNYKRVVYLAQRTDDALMAAEQAASTHGLSAVPLHGSRAVRFLPVDLNYVNARNGAEGQT